jgi:hypothetical protein
VPGYERIVFTGGGRVNLGEIRWVIPSFFFIFSVLGVELKTSGLLGKCVPLETRPQAFFAFIILEIVSHCCWDDK